MQEATNIPNRQKEETTMADFQCFIWKPLKSSLSRLWYVQLFYFGPCVISDELVMYGLFIWNEISIAYLAKKAIIFI